MKKQLLFLKKNLLIEKLNSQINSELNPEENKLELSFRKFDNIISKDRNRKEKNEKFRN